MFTNVDKKSCQSLHHSSNIILGRENSNTIFILDKGMRNVLNPMFFCQRKSAHEHQIVIRNDHKCCCCMVMVTKNCSSLLIIYLQVLKKSVQNRTNTITFLMRSGSV